MIRNQSTARRISHHTLRPEDGERQPADTSGPSSPAGPPADAGPRLRLFVPSVAPGEASSFSRPDPPAAASPPGGPTVRDLCLSFLAAKRIALEAEQLSSLTFADYVRACRQLVDQVGGERRALELGPRDFAQLFAWLCRRFGASTRGREINMIRGIFRHACDFDLLERCPKFGPDFKAPRSRHRRTARAAADRKFGLRLFGPRDVRAMIDAANVPLRAMILLGINAGFGNTDCARLPVSAVDWAEGWIDYPRPKTAVERRVPLWPETVAALRAAVAKRPWPAPLVDEDLVFLTCGGFPWVRHQIRNERDKLNGGVFKITQNKVDEVARTFTRLLKKLGLHRPRIGFYTLRHTFETIAGRSKDQVAVDRIMGHVDGSMAEAYREEIGDDRLRDVAGVIHRWLFGSPAKGNPDQRTLFEL